MPSARPSETRLSLLVFGFYLILLLLWLGKNRLLGLDESWYADMAKGEVRDGHWFPLYFQGHPFWDKPPLIPWVQGLCLEIFGMNEWALRLPSALAGVGVLFFTWRLGVLWEGAAAALLAAGALALEPHFILSARIATLDMPLVFCLTGFAWAWTRAFARGEKHQDRYLLVAGLFTALALWVKSWMGLIFFFPALAAQFLSPNRPFQSRTFWVYFLAPVALGLAAWLVLYGLTFGTDYFRWEWGFNMRQRIHPDLFALCVQRAGFYAALAQAGLPTLWPLFPLSLMLWSREAWRRRDPVLALGPLFLAAYSLFLVFFMNTLINYFLPWVVVAAWGLVFLYKNLGEPAVRLGAGFALLASLLNGWSGGVYGVEALVVSLALVFLPFLPLKNPGLSRRWIMALGLTLGLSLAFKAQDYLRHPPNPNRAWVAAVLKYPAKTPGEPLLFVGEQTDARALEFYSDYAVTCLPQLPPQRPAQALLFKAGPEAVFLPPR